MWPWGHLAVAYLLYSLFARTATDRPPRTLPAIALAIGSQFPDLVDKPLGWTFDVLPGGRTLGHSLLFAAPLLALAFLVAARRGRRDAAIAFAAGHVSHLVMDAPLSLARGDGAVITYLLWPFLGDPRYEEVGGIVEGLLRYSMGPYEWFQLVLLVLAVGIWYRDGTPGRGAIRPALERYAPISR